MRLNAAMNTHTGAQNANSGHSMIEETAPVVYVRMVADPATMVKNTPMSVIITRLKKRIRCAIAAGSLSISIVTLGNASSWSA